MYYAPRQRLRLLLRVTDRAYGLQSILRIFLFPACSRVFWLRSFRGVIVRVLDRNPQQVGINHAGTNSVPNLTVHLSGSILLVVRTRIKAKSLLAQRVFPRRANGIMIACKQTSEASFARCRVFAVDLIPLCLEIYTGTFYVAHFDFTPNPKGTLYFPVLASERDMLHTPNTSPISTSIQHCLVPGT